MYLDESGTIKYEVITSCAGRHEALATGIHRYELADGAREGDGDGVKTIEAQRVFFCFQ